MTNQNHLTKMNNIENTVLFLGLVVIVYYGYTKLAEFNENVEEKLNFF